MYVILVNPVAGKGRALKQFHRLKKEHDFPTNDFIVYFTKGHGDAERYVREFIHTKQMKKVRLFVVIGGDGTMHEVINGLNGIVLPIHYIRGGSGNDFFRGASSMDEGDSLYFPGNYLIEGVERKFVNCVGFGFDALVAKLANESRLKRLFNMLRLGRIVYVLSVIRALFTYKPIKLELQVDEKIHTFERVLFVVVNNHPYFGGGMKINPTARNEERYISAIVVDSIPKWKVLLLFVTVFFGAHLRFRGVTTYRGKEMMMRTKRHAYMQVDGEVSEANEAKLFKSGDYFSLQQSFNSKED